MQKQCSKCKKMKVLSEFNKRKKARDGVQSYCKGCSKQFGLNSYKKDPDRYHARHRNKRKSHYQKIHQYLQTHPCVDCGETDPIVLEFDHRDSKTKINAVSVLIGQSTSWENVFIEIQKCDVVCANCHRRRTAKQQNWYSYIEI